jgi:hypothetical protein
MTTNPEPTPQLHRHRLLPPRAFAAPVQLGAQGALTLRVILDQRNGVPAGAVLAPVVRVEDQWKLLRNGQPVELRDIRCIGADWVEAKLSHDGHTVTAPAWPGDTGRAVLLMKHPQTTLDGEVDFDEYVGHPEPVSLESGIVARGPDAPAEHVAFALGSCQYPAGMLDGTARSRGRALDDRSIGPAESSLWRLGARMEDDGSIRFTVLAGDQVYVDRTAGLFDPSRLLERIAFAYEAFMLNAGLQRVLRVAGTDIFPMLDDHEISDNWEPRPRGFRHDELQNEIAQGRRAYESKQRTMWPEAVRQRFHEGQLWGSAPVQGFEFFFSDARSQRQGRTIGNLGSASILGAAQEQALQKWIGDRGADARPAFVVSSSILLPRYLSTRRNSGGPESLGLALNCDSWAGYPHSLHSVLAWLYGAGAGAGGIVFLSGDEHLPSIATISIESPPDPRRVVVHSIHSSALYAPYTFANASARDFASPDRIAFSHEGRPFVCHVEAEFPDTGDGFAILRPYQAEGGGWRLHVEFDGSKGKFERALELS